MRIYLAGPMRGIPEFNFEAFGNATGALRRKGHTVFSPAERDLDAGFDPTGMTGNEDLSEHGFDLREALGVDLAYICEHADAVAVLPGWAKSSGARAEVAAAWALGVPVYRAHAMVADRLVSQEKNRIGSQQDVFSDGYDADHRFVRVGTWAKFDPDPEPQTAPTSFTVDGVTMPQIEEWTPEPEKVDGAEMVTSSTGGTKGRKLAEMGAIDPSARMELALVAGFGARKYARANYLLGIDWSLCVDALHRHLLAWESGEDRDEESGYLHTAHVAWHALALAAFQLRDIGTDDRCVDTHLDQIRNAA